MPQVDALLAVRTAHATAAPVAMPGYLLGLWEKRWAWRLKKSVPGMAFIDKVVAWFNEEGWVGSVLQRAQCIAACAVYCSMAEAVRVA